MKSLVEVKDLSVSYYTYAGKVQAVRGISFNISEGKTVALVGESGCGKSVTAKTLLGLIDKPGKVKNGSVVLFTMKQKLPGSQKKRKLPLIKLLIVYFELNWQAYAATIGASQPSVFNFFRYAFILRSLLN